MENSSEVDNYGKMLKPAVWSLILVVVSARPKSWSTLKHSRYTDYVRIKSPKGTWTTGEARAFFRVPRSLTR